MTFDLDKALQAVDRDMASIDVCLSSLERDAERCRQRKERLSKLRSELLQMRIERTLAGTFELIRMCHTSCLFYRPVEFSIRISRNVQKYITSLGETDV